MTETLKSPTQGDIFYITEDENSPSVGNEIWPNRCAVVVSVDQLNNYSHVCEMVYLSTSSRKRTSPTHIPVTSGSKTAIAMCEQVNSFDQSRFHHYVGRITPDELENVKRGIACGLGINSGTYPAGIFKKWEHYIQKYALFPQPENNERVTELQAEIQRLKTQIQALLQERDSLTSLLEAKNKIIRNIREMTA